MICSTITFNIQHETQTLSNKYYCVNNKPIHHTCIVIGNIPHVDHNQDALSDEDIPDNRSFIHRRYHNCARNIHESERFQRM